MAVPIVAAMRSPFAAADGAIAGWHPVDLGAEIANAALAAAGLDGSAVDHCWVGCDEPVGAQGANAARALVLAAGWPEPIGGSVAESAPHSGMSALLAAADAIAAGRVRTAVVVGMASASIVQPGAAALARLYGRPWGDGPATRYEAAGGLVPPIVAADRAAVAAGIDQAAQDAWGLQSVERRSAATPRGIVPIGARPGDGVAMQRDTPVAGDVVRAIPVDELVPMFDEDGTTTAAGFAPAADGCSVIVLQAGGNGVAELVAGHVAAGPPNAVADAARSVWSTLAPPPTARRWLATNSASTALTACAALDIDPSTVDPFGGTVAVGDAAAAEDLRLLVDGIHEPHDGLQVGVRVAAGAAAGCVWHRP